MTKEVLRERFKQYAISVARLITKIVYNVVNKTYCDQLCRSASSAAANYRAALRAKSTADFINKLKIVEEELDESIFFLELTETFNPAFKKDITFISKEGNELLSIIVRSLTTLRKKQIVSRNS